MVKALVVGSLVMDLSFQVPKRPAPGEVVIAESFGQYRGGKGYNQAVALARLGATVSLIGAVGADAFGDSFVAALEREGVDAAQLQRVAGSHTAVAVPIVTPDGDVAFVHAPGANRAVTIARPQALPPCDVLLLQGEVPAATSIAAAQTIRERGGLVMLNPAPVHDIPLELLDLADVVCPNEVEARALLGIHDEAVVDPSRLAQQLAAGSRTVVVTLGASGALFASAGQSGHVPPFDVQAIDATGAGDSFCAALALALVEGQALSDAVRFANAAGAHATTVRGAEPGLPTRRAIDELLRGI
jgi:ribokinase